MLCQWSKKRCKSFCCKIHFYSTYKVVFSLETILIPLDQSLIIIWGWSYMSWAFYLCLPRVITSHLQTFGSTLVVGKALDKVNLVIHCLIYSLKLLLLLCFNSGFKWTRDIIIDLFLFVLVQMVNTLALLLPLEERRRSRYAVETLKSDPNLYESDLFVQGLLRVKTTTIVLKLHYDS